MVSAGVGGLVGSGGVFVLNCGGEINGHNYYSEAKWGDKARPP